MKLFPIHILTQTAETHKDLEGSSVFSGPELNVFTFISTNSNRPLQNGRTPKEQVLSIKSVLWVYN